MKYFHPRDPFAPPRNPIGDAELLVAAQIAQSLMRMEMARRWGLVDDKGKPNLERCEQIRGLASEKGLKLDER